MKITRCLWKREFIEKLEQKHGVLQDEVEEVFRNRPRYKYIAKGNVKGENLYRALGQSDAGRYLTVLFVDKGAGGHWSSPLAIWMRKTGGDMGKSRKKKLDPLPDHFNSLEEAAEFWDTHSSADYEEYMKEAHFDVDLKWIVEEFRVAYDVMREVRKIARQRGFSTEALINLWLQEKVSQHQKRVTEKPKQTARKHSTKKTTRAQNGAARSVKA